MMGAIRQVLAERHLARLFEALDGQGEEIRIAGGAVRDALLGTVPDEIDLATTALPDEIVRRAEAAGLKPVPTGIEHGTVTVVVDGRPFEVTTLRRDVETDGRHAVVAFGRDWEEDAKRRDFTINGLFLDREGQVHDFIGGKSDIEARRIRFIGDATTRIREDYLRILRFFRFFARYADGDPDEEALHAAIAEREGLLNLSRERIRVELLKTLAARRAADAFDILSETGLFGLVTGGIARLSRLRRLWELEQILGRRPDPVLRLAAVGLFVEDDAERLRERLRLSNEEAGRLRALAGPPFDASGEASSKVLLYRLGAPTYDGRVMLGWIDAGASPMDSAWRDRLTLPERWTAPRFPIGGTDLSRWGVDTGPQMGSLLKALEERWIAAGFPDDMDFGAELARIRG
jgi:poly(A) polymerase